MKPVVYKIEFPDGSRYIGGTVDFHRRCYQHRKHARDGTAVNSALSTAFAVHGVSNAKFSVVAEVDSRELLHLAEHQAIITEKPNLNMHDVTHPVQCKGTGTAIPFGPYPSIAAAAKAFGRKEKSMRVTVGLMSYDEFVERLNAKAARKTRQRKTQVKTMLAFGGETKSLTQWSKERGLKPSVLNGRLRMGWTTAQALGVGASPREETRKLRAAEEKKPKSWMQMGCFSGRPCDLMRTLGVNDRQLKKLAAAKYGTFEYTPPYDTTPYVPGAFNADRYLFDEFNTEIQ